MMQKLSLVLAIWLAVVGVASAEMEAKGDERLNLREGEAVVYLAGGCFWGMEKLMSLAPGVVDAVSGYANGTMENPTYRDVCTGTTGHRETVRVVYRPDTISLRSLLTLYFSAIDPTVQDRQAHDIGSQYQTGIYYTNERDETVVRAVADEEKARHEAFYVEIAPLTAFYEAEDMHQDYLDVHPGGYCHISQEAFERARNLQPEPAPVAEYRRITAEEAKAMMTANPGARILDVRTEAEFLQGHIPGAELLPNENIGAEPPSQLPDFHETLLLYCRSGQRSRDAAQKLVAMGYTAVYDFGGINGWTYGITQE